MIRIGSELPDWADGDYENFGRWIQITGNGGVPQIDRLKFEFRPNTRSEITDWLLSAIHINGEIRTNAGGYRSEVSFDDDVSTMEFKLRWC